MSAISRKGQIEKQLELIDKWKAEKRFEKFINYPKLEAYRDFGGIRIEDDVLVLEDGQQVLGKPIPKRIGEVEELSSKSSQSA